MGIFLVSCGRWHHEVEADGVNHAAYRALLQCLAEHSTLPAATGDGAVLEVWPVAGGRMRTIRLGSLLAVLRTQCPADKSLVEFAKSLWFKEKFGPAFERAKQRQVERDAKEAEAQYQDLIDAEELAHA